jgi:hypothetical protein
MPHSQPLQHALARKPKISTGAFVMKNPHICEAGQILTFLARSDSNKTYIYFEPYCDENGSCKDTRAIYRIKAHDKPDVAMPIPANSYLQYVVFQNEDALITVRNAGYWPFKCWSNIEAQPETANVTNNIPTKDSGN